MFYDRFAALCNKKGVSVTRAAIEMGLSRTIGTKWKNTGAMPGGETLDRIAQYFGVSVDSLLGKADRPEERPKSTGGVWIPVLGRVSAGVPVEALQEVLDYEEITRAMAAQGEHFALQIKGDSMLPRIANGDVVIVRKQDYAETGDTVVVLVNGEEATVKKIRKGVDGIALIPNNPSFEPLFYTNREAETLPVVIIGKVVELRGKF